MTIFLQLSIKNIFNGRQDKLLKLKHQGLYTQHFIFFVAYKWAQS